MIKILKFKILSKDDMTQVQEMVRYCFFPSDNNYENISTKELDDYYGSTIHFGIVNDNVLCSTLRIILFKQMIRGIPLNMAGIAAVATKPEYRRKNLVKNLFNETFNYCFENNIPISVLFPFKYSYYEQFGYSWVDSYTMITGWNDAIKRRILPGYRVEEEKNKEKAIERMRPLYKKFYLETNGLVDRDYTINAFKNRFRKGYYFFSVDEEGHDTGYLVCWFVTDETITIREFIANDIKTRMNLWNFISSHDGQRQNFSIPDYLPHSIQTYPYLKEPRVKKVEFVTSAMMRIIDVKKTLEQLHYPNIVETVNFRVTDDYCEWNNKIWTLSINKDKIQIHGSNESEAKISLDIKGLAQLIVGFRSTIELAEQQWLSGNYDDYKILDKIFPKERFIVRDFF